MTDFHVIIPAAGSGSRMGGDLPKQYLPLLGKPLVLHSLAVFIACPRITSISVIASPQDQFWNDQNSQLGETLASPKLRVQYCGGNTRAATVLNGLIGLNSEVGQDDWVLVHDAARPGLSAGLLNALIDALEDDPVGGLLAVPLADTLKRADGQHRVASTEPRDHLWLAQTPQMFRYAMLKRALEIAGGSNTDEAQAVESLGLKPKLIQGELRNLKITYPQDLALIEALLKTG